MSSQETVIEFLKQKGPILPVQLAKHLNTNILFASAHLSELSSSKKVKISYIKVGGSPLYYLPGQESMLENFSDNLNEKELRAYDLIKDKKVLKDSSLDPLFQVAIRQLKDFAKPIEVSFQDKKEIFWKWHTLSEEDTKNGVSDILNPAPKEEPKPTSKEPEKTSQKIEPSSKPKEPVEEPNDENIPLKETSKTEEKGSADQEPKTPYLKQEQKNKDKPKSEFQEKIEEYFNQKGINVLEHASTRKTDHEFIIKLPSRVGELTYFCKAKDKKAINDGDVSSAFIQSQSKKLPALFLTTGKLTKKAQELIEKEFKGMTILTI